MDNICAIFFGANDKDPLISIQNAIKTLENDNLFKIEKTSSIYLTEPVETNNPQPYFYNLLAYGKTRLNPHSLLSYLKGVEQDMGRKGKNQKKKRVIDLDIIFYNDVVIKTKELTLPHPALLKRRCLLIPLIEILPEWRHPETGLTPQEILPESIGKVSLYTSFPLTIKF